MNKIIKILVANSILLLSIISLYCTASAANTMVSLNGKTVSVGTETDLTLTLSNNPGIHNLKVKISYETSKMSIVSVTNSGIFSGLEYNTNNNSVLDMIFSGSSSQNTTGNGTLCTIKIKPISGSAGDKYNLTLSGEAVNINIVNQPLQFNNGYIQIPNYTVKYDANGGTGAPTNQTKITGTNLTLSSEKPIKTGYNFKGWSTSKTETTAQYYSGGIYSNNASITLYAVWELNSYTVKYDANGGIGAPESQHKNYGVPITLSTIKPTKKGVNFIGWSTSITQESELYQPGGSYSYEKDLTLYAIWSDSYYLVKYDANGGYGTPGSQIKEINKTLTLSDTIPTKTDMEFIGWSSNKNAAAAEYISGGTYALNNNITLYAVWSEVPKETFTVKYEGNGGTNIPKTENYIHGKEIEISNIIPIKDNCEFLGWSIEKDSAIVNYVAKDTYFVDSNVTLYAVWKQNILNGDINIDGIINGKDVVLLRQYLAGWPSANLTEQQIKTGDVTGDGLTNGKDIVKIRQYLAGWPGIEL